MPGQGALTGRLCDATATGTPLFGLLAGTELQGRLAPDPVAALLSPEKTVARAQGRGGPVAVTIGTVQVMDIAQSASFSGRMTARREVELVARVTGYLAERRVPEASFVEKGTVLFRLDPSTFETRVAEFEAALSGARAAHKFFRLQVRRISELEADEFAAQSRLDKLVRQRDEAAADVARLKAELRRARLDLDFTTIEAPFAGKFGFANVDVGNLVTAGQTRLGSLTEVDPIEVTFSPSAEQLSALERARAERGKPVPVVVRVDGHSDPFRGEIVGLGPRFAPQTNTIEMRARLDNAEGVLVPGQFARVRASGH